jgi:glycosyltransferase A (GT-A) superfamily protein (DUF2064 family)
MICVLARPALPGQSKLRLAPVLGADWAAELGRAFLADTWRTATRLPNVRAVLVQTEPGPTPRLVPEVDLTWQLDEVADAAAEGAFGARIEALIARALLEAPWVIVLATDTPALPSRALELGARALVSGSKAVIGPCEHGGWYLLGLRRNVPGLLEGVNSAASASAEALAARLTANELEPLWLEPVYEVEQPADLVRLRAELRSGVVKASATARALRRSGTR